MKRRYFGKNQFTICFVQGDLKGTLCLNNGCNWTNNFWGFPTSFLASLLVSNVFARHGFCLFVCLFVCLFSSNLPSLLGSNVFARSGALVLPTIGLRSTDLDTESYFPQNERQCTYNCISLHCAARQCALCQCADVAVHSMQQAAMQCGVIMHCCVQLKPFQDFDFGLSALLVHIATLCIPVSHQSCIAELWFTDSRPNASVLPNAAGNICFQWFYAIATTGNVHIGPSREDNLQY